MAGNPFSDASAIVDDVSGFVSGRILDTIATAETLRGIALSAISDIASGAFVPFSQMPQAPSINTDIGVDFDLPSVNATSFGTLSPPSAGDPPTGDDIPNPLNVIIPEFSPSVTQLNIPEPPEPVDLGALPDAPVLGDITLPAPPTIVDPVLEPLEELSIPDFDFPVIPTFDEQAPEFTATDVDTNFEWVEPVYVPTILNETISKLRDMWDGKLGLPEAVEQALFERAVGREDLDTERTIREIDVEFSKRGFTEPNGMHAARIDGARQAALVTKQGLQREILIKVTEEQLTNLRLAVEQSVAVENVLVNIFLNMAQRTFQAAQFTVESQLRFYDAQVALFNAQQSAYQTAANVFRIEVDAELSKIQVFRAQIDAEIAKGQLNEQKVNVFNARVNALRNRIELFVAQMRGAETEANVQRAQVDVFRAEVEAYGERVDADKTRFDAYLARVQAETAKAGLLNAEANAYAAQVQGLSTKSEVDIRRIEAIISSNRNLFEQYNNRLAADNARSQNELAVIQSAATAYTANTERFGAQAAAEGEKARAEIAASQVELQTVVSFYSARVQAFIGETEQLIRAASINVEALTAAGQLSTTLAAGAMAGVNIGANLSGSGGVSASGSTSDSFSRSFSESTETSTRTNINIDGN